MKKYRCAVVGCGRIASTMDDDPKRKNVSSHAGAYRRNGRVELVAAAEPNAARREAFGRKWGVARLYRSADELFAREELDVVSVCTRSDAHLAVVKAAARAGVKAVLCEKPLALTLAEADDLVRTAKKAKLLVQTCHVRRWYLAVQEAKRLLDAGAIGEPTAASLAYCAGLANQGIHVFDALWHLLGRAPVRAQAVSVDERFASGDLNVSGRLALSGGVGCNVGTVSRKSYTFEELDLHGTKGRLVLDHMSSRLTVYKAKPSERFSDFSELVVERQETFDEGPRMEAVLDNVLDALEGRAELLCPAADARPALAMTSALLESVKTKRPVELKRQTRNLKVLSA